MASRLVPVNPFHGLDRFNQALDQRQAMAQNQQAQQLQERLTLAKLAELEQANQLQQRRAGVLAELARPQQVAGTGPLRGAQDYQPVQFQEQPITRERIFQGLSSIGDTEGALKFAPKEQEPFAGLTGEFRNMASALGRIPTWDEYQKYQEKTAAAGATKIDNYMTPATPGQKKTDEIFAQEFNDFVSAGGVADVQKNLGQLQEVRNMLAQRDDLTGPIVGNLPDFLQPIVAPQSVAAREAVEEVVQRNLRTVLGAQFTEKEGSRLIARAYNPRLDEAENIKRVDRLIGQIASAAQSKLEAARYFEENGTLKGWKGKLYTVNDFMADNVPTTPSAANPPMSGARQAPDGNWYVQRGDKFFRVEK